MLKFNMENQKKWYALYTKPRWEKKIDMLLRKKGIECWCPLQKLEKQWTDRKKIIEEPLFRSYVFVRIDETESARVKMTDGVLNFVFYLGKPAIIREEEIDMIQKYLGEKEATLQLISDEGFREDTKIRINYGVFMDREGVVTYSDKKKVYVRLQSLGQVMVVEFPHSHVSLI
jgi:transcription antitermination factor NusG